MSLIMCRLINTEFSLPPTESKHGASGAFTMLPGRRPLKTVEKVPQKQSQNVRKKQWPHNKQVSINQAAVQREATECEIKQKQGKGFICSDAEPLSHCWAGTRRNKNYTHCSINIMGWRNHIKDILPYLLVSSLCVWSTRSPIPACGGPRKRSEAGRSTAACVACKSLAWMAGGHTEARERERRRMEKGALQHKRISSCLKNLSPWQQIPLLPPSPVYAPPSPSVSVAESTWAPLSEFSDVIGWCPDSCFHAWL